MLLLSLVPLLIIVSKLEVFILDSFFSILCYELMLETSHSFRQGLQKQISIAIIFSFDLQLRICVLCARIKNDFQIARSLNILL